MTDLIRPAFSIFVMLTVMTGAVYPLLVGSVGKTLFPKEAGGSLIEADGKLVGSELIGQDFSDAHYFWGRLSATATRPYNGAASGGSNIGPLNPALAQNVKARIEALRAADPGNDAPVPVDLVTASGSGLDPDISPAAALYQVRRVASARHLPEAAVRDLVERHVQGRQFGIFGEPHVNVLALNRALYQLR